MKRFYKAASFSATDSGFAILLDGKAVRTPLRAPLAVPTAALAQNIAAEWNAQGEEIAPASMVATGLANAAIDQIQPDCAAFAKGIAAYGESDLLCYRADGPAPLIRAQDEAWNPLLDWAERHYGITFTLATGIIHVPQREDTLAVLAQAVAKRDAFTLAGLSTLVSLSGSLVIGLAVLETAFPIERLWRAAELDEIFQAEQWGEDALALERRIQRGAEFQQAADFVGYARPA